MSPYRDFDVRSDRKMKPSVGRTASFMSTTTTGTTRQPHFSGGGQGQLLRVRFAGVRNNPILSHSVGQKIKKSPGQKNLLNQMNQFHENFF